MIDADELRKQIVESDISPKDLRTVLDLINEMESKSKESKTNGH